MKKWQRSSQKLKRKAYLIVSIVLQLSKCLKFEAVWGGIKLIK